MMNFSKYLAKHGTTKLFYVVSLHNLESILKRGILCKQSVDQYTSNRHDISSKYMQNHRQEFHSHVPLFFTDNTPMLYVCCSERHKNIIDIILLEIAPEVTNREEVLFFDGNATLLETKRYDHPADLDKLDWKVIQSREGAYRDQWKRIRAAEVHIPKVCPASYIQGVHFQSRLSGGRSKLEKAISDSPQLHTIFVKDSLTPTGI